MALCRVRGRLRGLVRIPGLVGAEIRDVCARRRHLRVARWRHVLLLRLCLPVICGPKLHRLGLLPCRLALIVLLIVCRLLGEPSLRCAEEDLVGPHGVRLAVGALGHGARRRSNLVEHLVLVLCHHLLVLLRHCCLLREHTLVELLLLRLLLGGLQLRSFRLRLELRRLLLLLRKLSRCLRQRLVADCLEVREHTLRLLGSLGAFLLRAFHNIPLHRSDALSMELPLPEEGALHLHLLVVHAQRLAPLHHLALLLGAALKLLLLPRGRERSVHLGLPARVHLLSSGVRLLRVLL
mmetsp:Transcript_52000/g.105958  ORF Transcript_52000/g.105958 Transcript_52000/m.105958 type:complete len:294 (+) Transcript_52000:157-1038(+)